jgi:hypothetical protein
MTAASQRREDRPMRRHTVRRMKGMRVGNRLTVGHDEIMSLVTNAGDTGQGIIDLGDGWDLVLDVELRRKEDT